MRAVCSLLFVVLCSAAVARAEGGADHVKVDLLADTAAVQPGKPFTLGVRFKIDPGWHIYWTNPGDSGLPTRVKLDLPAGFKADETQYPVPAVLKLPGDIINYAYEREVTLLVRVVPPATLPTSIPIAVHADYLVCSANCLPGAADAKIELPVGAASTSNAVLFNTWMARLPSTPPAGFAAKYNLKSASGNDAFHIRIDWPAGEAPKDVQWLPPIVPDCDMDAIHVAMHDRVTDIDFKLTQTGKEVRPDAVSGLITYSRADGSRVGFPLPIYPNLKPGVARSYSVGSGS